MQCKLSLNEKLERLRTLEEEILTIVEDDIETEIEQADQFKERIHLAMFRLQHTISIKESSAATVAS